jgi:hypothetical protein
VAVSEDAAADPAAPAPEGAEVFVVDGFSGVVAVPLSPVFAEVAG